MAGPPRDAVPADTVALFLVGDAGVAMHDGVDLVAPAGEAARHLEDMDAASGAARDVLGGGHVDDPHRPPPAEGIRARSVKPGGPRRAPPPPPGPTRPQKRP